MTLALRTVNDASAFQQFSKKKHLYFGASLFGGRHNIWRCWGTPVAPCTANDVWAV